MLDIVSKIVALIVAIIGAITTIFNVFFKGEQKRKEGYYTKLLKPFAIAYKRDPNINAIDFVKHKVIPEDDEIPKYVFYLLDMPDIENDNSNNQECLSDQEHINILHPNNNMLKKVLLDDYLTLYPNECNRKRNICEVVQKMLHYLMFLLTFIFTVFGAIIFAGGVTMLISHIIMLIANLLTETNHAKDFWGSILYIIFGIVISFLGFVPIRISERMSNDMYTVKKKQINKTIAEKVKRFDKRFKNYVI